MNEPWTIHAALAWGGAQLTQADGATEPRDPSILLEYVLRVDHATVLAHPERTITWAQVSAYRSLIVRRLAGVPIAQLIGHRAFYDLDFYVTPDVLIPRPETEHLVDAALAWGRDRADLRVVDVGTGSGAIAVTLAHQLPAAHVWAVDVSAAALAVAQHNAVRHAVAGQITFVEGDLLAPLMVAGATVDLIVANLPYIPTEEIAMLEVSQHEPHVALDGGPDGLDLIRWLLVQAPAVLADEGVILLEFGAAQGERVRDLAVEAFPSAEVTIITDLAGHDRLVQVVQ